MKNYIFRLIMDDPVDGFSRFIKMLLRGLSLIYHFASGSVRVGYQTGFLQKQRAARPVISVGNLTLGGTGKTPLVSFLARRLQSKGCHPAILTRGYMTSSHPSDEAMLYQQELPNVPVQIGKDRMKASQQVLKMYPQTDVFLLDDGFQHWRLNRDLDIVTIDTTNAFSNGFLLPRGFLREPITALQRADILLLNKVDLAPEQLPWIYQQIARYNFHAIVAEAVYQPRMLIDLKNPAQRVPVSFLSHQDVCLVCAIGNPKAFKKTVYDLGAMIQQTFIFEDHHAYSFHEVQRMMAQRSTKAHIFVTTQKDAVKLRALMGAIPDSVHFFALEIELRIIKKEQELEQRVDTILRH